MLMRNKIISFSNITKKLIVEKEGEVTILSTKI